MAASLGRTGHDYMTARGVLVLLAAAGIAGPILIRTIGFRTGTRPACALPGPRRPNSCGGPRVYHGGDIGERKTDGQFDLPRAKEGGPGALFFFHLRHRGLLPGAPGNQTGAAHAGLRR